MRNQNIDLLNYLIFGAQPGAPTPGRSPGLPAAFGGMGGQAGQQNLLSFLNPQRGPTSTAPPIGQAGDPTQRLENIFGKLAPEGIQQFLSQPTPEQRALDTSLPALQEILTPGTMNPALSQDLALANQQGGRFGSANEILRGQALTGLFNLRNQAANTLGVLGSQAGAGQARQAGFMDIETQRRLQLLMSLLGTSQSASFNLPFVTQPSTLDTLGQIAGTAVGVASGGLFGGGGGGGTETPPPGTINTRPRGP